MNQVVEKGPMPLPVRANNPFEAQRLPATQSGGGIAEVERAIAETRAAIMLAKQFPRDRVSAVDRILTECTRNTLAEKAEYSFPRGGQEVSGPTIRLAEVLATQWGNNTFGWKETSRRIDGTGTGVSDIVAYAWDYETNVRTVREFTVRHWRDTRQGGYPLKDERDIYELCANQASRRMRACILQIIPGDVIEAAVNQCNITLKSNVDVSEDGIKKLLEAFAEIGVSKAQIEKRIGRKATAESLKNNGAVILQLRKIYAGIRDGMADKSEFFEPELAKETPEAGKNLGDGKAGDAAVNEGLAKAEADKVKAAEAALPPSDWDAFADELIAGLQSCADDKTIDAFIDESQDAIGKLQDSKDKSAMKRWAEAVARRRKDVSPKGKGDGKLGL